MVALVVLIAITGILLGGFAAMCRSIRRLDKRGTLRPEPFTQHRHHMLAFASRWDDNRQALA